MSFSRFFFLRRAEGWAADVTRNFTEDDGDDDVDEDAATTKGEVYGGLSRNPVTFAKLSILNVRAVGGLRWR